MRRACGTSPTDAARRRSTMKARAAVWAAVAVALGACSHHVPREDEPMDPPGSLGASLSVVNHGFFDYAVYVIYDGSRERVGIAPAAGQTDFLLRPHQLGHAGQIVLEGHAIGTTVTYDSPAFNVSGGQQIEWTLEQDVTRSTVAVY
jgi:hypothetical protein